MSTWEETMQELRIEFLQRLTERSQKLDETLNLLIVKPDNRDVLKSLMRLFHALSGSGSTYGFPEISAIGRIGEKECDHLLQNNLLPDPSYLAGWQKLLRQLDEEAVKANQNAAPTPEAVIESVLPETKEASLANKILIVEKDPNITAALTQALQQEGFQVHIETSLKATQNILETHLPDGAIIDIELSDGNGYQLVEYVRSLPHGDLPPLLVISGVQEFFDKVEAIRCGADGFFEKPLNYDALVSRLQLLLEKNKIEPAHILYVEDDSDQAAYVKAILESASYKVRICEDPNQLDIEMSAFQPNLIIMDLLLPKVSGHELARYLKQNEAYATLPIVFLSTQGQLQAQIETVKAGGDDHLVKPVSPPLLLSTVAARVERARFLKSLLERDGLTRLLTHTAFLEKAKMALLQRVRYPNKQVAFVMIDIDHFKSVNDRYGHPVGDRVIASLSALLRRRLRQTDIIGRYGGEEFALLVENLTTDEASRLVIRLLEEFSLTDQQAADGKLFRCTFSAGIAMLTPSMTVESWKTAADNALYQAKAAGRNRVMVAEPATK